MSRRATPERLIHTRMYDEYGPDGPDGCELSPRHNLSIITKEQHKAYQRDGFLLLRNFYEGTTLEELKRCLEEVQHTKEEVGGQMMWFEEGSGGQGRILNRVEDFCRRHKGMEVLFMDPKRSKLAKDKINFKLPGGDGFKAHQDQAAGWGKYIDWFMNIGVFVDASTKENGALEVALGYHKNGLLGAEWEHIVDLDLPYELVECGPGDVIFFDSYLPHRSAPNNSDKPRRAIFLTYNKESEGFVLDQYYKDKRESFPPDIERPEGKKYVYRV